MFERGKATRFFEKATSILPAAGGSLKELTNACARREKPLQPFRRFFSNRAGGKFDWLFPPLFFKRQSGTPANFFASAFRQTATGNSYGQRLSRAPLFRRQTAVFNGLSINPSPNGSRKPQRPMVNAFPDHLHSEGRRQFLTVPFACFFLKRQPKTSTAYGQRLSRSPLFRRQTAILNGALRLLFLKTAVENFFGFYFPLKVFGVKGDFFKSPPCGVQGQRP